LIIAEMRCQGKTELLSEHGTVEQHAQDFRQFIFDKLGFSKIDLAGFSFGGRIGLAIAATYPDLVGRLSVTGVPLERPALGKLILQSWKEGLQEGHIRNCAWSFILNGYSAPFIERYHNRLELFVDMIVEANPDPKKLADLLEYSHSADLECDFGVASCAARLSGGSIPTQIIAGTHDRIAGLESVKQLADAIENSRYLEIDAGHLVPFEKPLEWRNALLKFMNEDISVTTPNKRVECM
jgi:pimeloyl-ACP methyl ester carboxylesterase